MIEDPLATAELATREVRSGERGGEPTKIAVLRRAYSAGPTDLWSALTDAERIPRWFLPVTGDLRVGGSYALEGNAHGVIERCDPVRSFSVTWEYGDQVSWLDVILTPAEAGTILELVHEAHVDPGMWAQFGPGAVGIGWDLGLMGLGLHLESGAPVDPEAGQAFTFTPEGRAFVRRAADDWAQAAAADGDDVAQAREAAERTIAFYTTVSGDAPEA